MKMITFLPKGKRIAVKPRESILDAALEIGLRLRHVCDRKASCTTCKVLVETGMEHLSPMEKKEAEMLGEGRIAQNIRLSCQARLTGTGSVTVVIPNLYEAPKATA